MDNIILRMIDNLSSYNLLNNLIPGITYIVLVNSLTAFVIKYNNLLELLAIAYVIGLIISRIGSLVVDRIFGADKTNTKRSDTNKKMWLDRRPYEQFIEAENRDSKLGLLSEVNNMYRTLIALFLCFGFAYIANMVALSCPLIQEVRDGIILCLVFLIILILCLSYRKQTQYISRRIDKALKSKPKEDN